MKLRSIIAILFAAATLIGCGNKYKAKGVVKDFLATNLVKNDISGVSFSTFDSTFHIKDSLVTAMRTTANSSPAYKKGISYGEKQPGNEKLFFLRTEYTNADGKQIKETFYLTPDVEKVVCFKEN